MQISLAGIRRRASKYIYYIGFILPVVNGFETREYGKTDFPKAHKENEKGDMMMKKLVSVLLALVLALGVCGAYA